MPVSRSGRIVAVIDANLKKRLHSRLILEGQSLKDWLSASAREYVTLNKPKGRKKRGRRS